MKTLLIAINSQYVHLNLAIRSLNANINHKAEILEFNINSEINKVFADIVLKKPDLILFSTYIWNIEYILKLAEDIKKALPNIKIGLGGPEVSFTSQEILKENLFIDYILIGECEEILDEFIKRVENKLDFNGLTGVVSKDYIDETYNLVDNLDNLKPVQEIYNKIEENKIYYYETSRGCPFSCSYCLSGSIKDKTRYLSLERVFEDLIYFTDNNIPLVKFVDRTFNANKKRAKEIIKFASKNTKNTSFHFEIGADILDDELIDLLNNAPKDKFQLEAGVQSCNELTLKIVARETNLKKLAENTTKIINANNIHMHLDLIAGLPYEDFKSFKNSFNELYKLNPHHLQLGFLKLLKGSKLLEEADKYGIIYRNYPPYEVISTNDITAEELLLLKDIEEIVERYYNKELGREALEIFKENFETPFDMFNEIAKDFHKKGYLSRPMSISNRLLVLCEFVKDFYNIENKEIWHKFLYKILIDLLKNNEKGSFPIYLEEIILNIDIKPYRNKLLELEKISAEEFKKSKFIMIKIENKTKILVLFNGKIKIFLKEDIC